MKKFFAGILCMLISLSLVACQSSSVPTNEQAKQTETKTESALTGKLVGFSQTDSMSAWRTTETDSISEAVKAAGANIIVKDAGGDIATQESDIRDLIAAGVNLLVVAPLENNGLQGA